MYYLRTAIETSKYDLTFYAILQRNSMSSFLREHKQLKELVEFEFFIESI